MCHSKAKSKVPEQHSLQMDEESSDSKPDFSDYGMHYVSLGRSKQILAAVETNESKL